jgi:hypothetical protein
MVIAALLEFMPQHSKLLHSSCHCHFLHQVHSFLHIWYYCNPQEGHSLGGTATASETQEDQAKESQMNLNKYYHIFSRLGANFSHGQFIIHGPQT